MTWAPRNRYDIRKNSDSTWEIFDTTTGRTVIIGGKPYCDLPQDIAETFVAFMNSAEMVPDREILH